MDNTQRADNLSVEEIKSKVAAFDRWHYEFDLRGVKTPIFRPDHRIRHQQRKAYFFDPMVSLLGGSLKGKRVLDLGCNAGFWSLCAIEAGCDFLLGIDGRQFHIDQANLVFQAKDVAEHRYEFRLGNIFDLVQSELGKFDIVLCLGLLYHISKHMDLFERMASVVPEILLIDTVISPRPESLLELRHESTNEPRHAIDYELVMIPTRRALADMAAQFGYKTAVLEPRFASYIGSDDYEEGRRRAFVCGRSVNLDVLAQEPTSSDRSGLLPKIARRIGLRS